MLSSRRHWLGLAAAVGSLVLITAIRLVKTDDARTQSPHLLFALAVVIASLAGGFWTAMATTLLALLLVELLFIDPFLAISFSDQSMMLSHALFGLQGLIIGAMGEIFHRSTASANIARDELESRVEHRTTQLALSNHQLMQEVHERTDAERRLTAEGEFLNAMLDSLQAGIIASDATGMITRHNRAAREMCGIEDPEFPADQWHERVQFLDVAHRTPLGERLLPLQRVLKEGSIDEQEVILVAADGCERFVSISGRAMVDSRGQRLGAVISLHDVTARVEAQQRLGAVVEELQRSNRELQDFASVASHDLQEPLRKIQAFGDRLKVTQGDRLNDQGRDYLSRMHSAAARMQILINDLLAFSRVTTKGRPFEEVNLNELVTDVLEDLEERLERSGGRVEVADLPTIDADPLQLRQLVQNLLSNALKFAKPDVPPVVRVYEEPITADPANEDQPEQITAHNAARWVRLCVADNGIGLDEKYLDRIFNIFQRLHGRAEYEGTGVGLAVCRKIVERHGGRLTARSRPNEGATFLVTLPRRQQEVRQAHALNQADHDSVSG